MTMSENTNKPGPIDTPAPAQRRDNANNANNAPRSILGTALSRIEDGGIRAYFLLYAGLAGLALIVPVLLVLYASLRGPELEQKTVLWIAFTALAAVLAGRAQDHDIAAVRDRIRALRETGVDLGAAAHQQQCRAADRRARRINGISSQPDAQLGRFGRPGRGVGSERQCEREQRDGEGAENRVQVWHRHSFCGSVTVPLHKKAIAI